MSSERRVDLWSFGVTVEIRGRLYFAGVPFIGDCRWSRWNGRYRWIGRTGVIR